METRSPELEDEGDLTGYVDGLEQRQQEQDGDEEDDMVDTAKETEELAPLGAESTREDYFDDERSEQERHAFALAHPERIAAFLEEVDHETRRQVKRPTEEEFAAAAELIDADTLDRGGTLKRSAQIRDAIREGVVGGSEEDLAALVADISQVRGGGPVGRDPEARAALVRLAIVNDDLARVRRAPTASVLIEQHYDGNEAAWITTQGDVEIGRLTNDKAEELLAERDRAAADEGAFGVPDGHRGNTITPGDASGWSATKWHRFRTSFPVEADQLLQGQTVTGLRPKEVAK